MLRKNMRKQKYLFYTKSLDYLFKR